MMNCWQCLAICVMTLNLKVVALAMCLLFLTSVTDQRPDKQSNNLFMSVTLHININKMFLPVRNSILTSNASSFVVG